MTEGHGGLVRTAVESRMTSFEAAERALDADALLEHFSPTDTFYLYNDGQRLTFETMAAAVRTAFPTLSRLEGGFADVAIHVLGPDAALVTAPFRETITTMSGAVVRQRGVASWLWRLQGAHWRIACGHVDHYPDDSPAGAGR